MSGIDGTPTASLSSAAEEETATSTSGTTDNECGKESPPTLNEDEYVLSREQEVRCEGHTVPEVQGHFGTSQVYTATSKTLFPEQESMSPRIKTHPLALEWVFGINKALPVFSLQDEEQLVILYGGAHVAVMYNHTCNSQHILQGHRNPVSCLCASEDRRWLVTADKGSESLVIVWDSYSGIPVRSLFDCHPEGGVAAVALSSDSKYLVTVGAGEIQRVCIWNWTNESENPLCTTDLGPEYGHQHHILFHPSDSMQLLSNSATRVLFYTWDKGHLDFSAPDISDTTFSREVGPLSQSIFHPEGVQAMTATLMGNLVLWDILYCSVIQQASSRRATKLIRLQKDSITVLTHTDRFIVTGDARGRVYFYDESLKLITWYSEFHLGPITSISFSKEEACFSGGLRDCSLEAKPIRIRNFVLCTSDATIVHVNAHDHHLRRLLSGHSGALHAVACHPSQPVVAMGSLCGLLQTWHYQKKEHICSRVFTEEIHCMAYDPQGVYLAVGFASGTVEIMNAVSLKSEEAERFNYTKDCITHMGFSLDSHYLATADAGNTITVFWLRSKDSGKMWRYVGRHRSHYKPIRDLLFGVQLDSTQPRLLSLGMDRVLVEYDLRGSSQDGLGILSMDRVEQSAVPMCMAWYPPLTTENFLLTVSDHYKMKLFNSTTKMCRKTLLGPTYESPVEKVFILPKSAGGNPDFRYLAYITTDKVGLQILPLDGNPHKTFALVCHPTGVSTFACSFEGKFIFTAGGADCTVLTWEINTNALEAVASLGGQDMNPFYGLLEGGRDGEFYKEMEDYFYYCQLSVQGIDSMETRQLATTIPVTEVPFIMRALGFFPTEQEIEDMLNEVKFSRYAETGQYVTDVDLEEFIKLYINHRPVSDISNKEIQEILEVLGVPNENRDQCLKREELLELLQARGEHMTEEELVECFTTLLGLGPEGGRCELGNLQYIETDAEALLERTFPAQISAHTLAVDILGFHVPSGESTLSGKERSPAGSPISQPEV